MKKVTNTNIFFKLATLMLCLMLFWGFYGVQGSKSTVNTTIASLKEAGELNATLNYEVTSAWPGGFGVNVSITNNGANKINGWAVTFTFPGTQKINDHWNAIITQDGQKVTARYTEAMKIIEPGQTIVVGFIGAGDGKTSIPSDLKITGDEIVPPLTPTPSLNPSLVPSLAPSPSVAPSLAPSPSVAPTPSLSPSPTPSLPPREVVPLEVIGANLCDQEGNSVLLKGMSSHGLQWFGNYMNRSAIQWLRDDWRANLVRAAMYTDPAANGYIQNRSLKDKVNEIVQIAIDLGIYVIIDWHILNDNNPNTYKTEAIGFFKEMANKWGSYPNVIYEICNEPNGNVTWERDLRPYAVEVINEIRKIDPDNIIIIGSGTWSQDIHQAADNPIEGRNLMYALHFYSGTHGQGLRDRITYAMGKNCAIFVSEFGTSQASGSGGVYVAETNQWLQFLADNKISWANWSLCDKSETSAALRPGASSTGGWSDWDLSESGKLIKDWMKK